MLTSTVLLSALPVGLDVQVSHSGLAWTFTRHVDDAIEVASGSAVDAMLPPRAMLLDTAAQAIEAATLACDRYRLIALLACALDHGETFQAPVYPPPRDGHHHATVGQHPDGRGGYAVVLDPGAIVLTGQVEDPHIDPLIGLYHTTEEDRGPFATAVLFVAQVGQRAAAVAYVARRSACS